jgi:hypothetical protein
MAKKLKIDFNEPATKRVKFDPALNNGSICKKKLSDFPDEILLKILNFVDTIELLRLQQVNKRFHTICQDLSLCQRVEMYNQDLPAEFIQKQLDGGCKYLNLRNCKIRNLRLKQPIQPSKLEDLNLSLCDFDIQSLLDLLLPCHSLQKLTLTNVTSSGIDVSRSNLFGCFFDRICLRNGSTLQVLSIKPWILMGIGPINAIVGHCLELKELDISRTYFHVLSTSLWFSQEIDILVENLTPKIVKLRLGHISREINDDHVEKLVKRCSNLKVLDLSGSARLTNNSLRSIVRYLKSTLEELGVVDTQIEVDDLFESRALPKLKRLY